jgi:protein involved in polysaccharide export with SLBB domain
MSAKLPIHEWCIILLFCLILLVLAGFAFNRPKPAFATILPSSEPIATILEVRIEGHVAKPGLYRLPLNAKLKDLLEQAQPLSSADLSQLNWRRKLRNGQTLHVPERRLITIQLAGAVCQPGPLLILSGTRCCELADQLQVLPEADLSAMRKKKRFLQEGDHIEIPVKRKKKNSGTTHLSS